MCFLKPNVFLTNWTGGLESEESQKSIKNSISQFQHWHGRSEPQLHVQQHYEQYQMDLGKSK